MKTFHFSLFILLASTLALSACDDKKKQPDAADLQASAEEVDQSASAKEAPESQKADSQPAGHHDTLQIMLDPGADKPEPVKYAIAMLHPTKDSMASGTVRFEQTDKGLKFTSTFKGLTPGKKHAHHIHIYGDCSGEDGKTAGTHFHVKGASLNPPKDIAYITGNLGDLEADKDGNASLEGMLEGGSLQGKFTVLGRSVIVHEKENDHKAPPIGAAGGRLGCGVIGLTPNK